MLSGLPLFPPARAVPALAWVLAALATTGVAAQDLAAPRYPTTEFAAGASKASVSVGAVSAIVELARSPDSPAERIARLTVRVSGRQVLVLSGGPVFADFPAAEASIAEMDPTNSRPEVYFSTYSGGAHCCTSVAVATETAGGWVGVAVGEFDGGGDLLEDVNNDGVAEIVAVDNRFLYQFDCYACSAAPLQILAIRNGAVADVSRQAAYRTAHRQWLKELEDNVDPADRWSSPGFLAGWVASKAQVGEFDDAWRQLVAHWDWSHDAGEEVCLSGVELNTCPRFDRATLKFPERLKRFLDQTGYTR